MLSICNQIPQESIESISSDYDLIKTIYQDETHEIENQDNKIKFLLKQKYEIEINDSLLSLLREMKFDDLIINNSLMYLPYWLQFDFIPSTRTLKIDFFIYWFRKNQEKRKELSNSISSMEEPYLYNAIENTKLVVENSLNKDSLLNLLSEIKEMIIINMNMSTDNFLLKLTGANKDLGDFMYETKQLPAKKENIKPKKDNEEIQSKGKITTSNNTNEDDDNSKYDLFFEEGGVVGETVIDRASVFQAHAIKVTSLADISKYKKYLLSQKKIKKATHNISAYRFLDKKSQEIFEDYDDDGEDDAGIRLLGIIKKMKVNNVLVVVSRWFGGILLHHDRFKHINDVAKILLNNNIDKFK